MGKVDELVRLAGVVATRMSQLRAEEPGGVVSETELSALLEVLELFVPLVLRQRFQEWEVESLDGFLVAEANMSIEGDVSLVSLAILISDQTVTPCHLGLHPAKGGSLERAEILLGERGGGGALGISGPICTNSSVPSLVEGLKARLHEVEWVYRETYIRP